MSNPTGNAINAAAIPDAREARLLALVEKWEEKEALAKADAMTEDFGYEKGFCRGEQRCAQMCARELQALLVAR